MENDDAGFKSPSAFLESSVNHPQSIKSEAQPEMVSSPFHQFPYPSLLDGTTYKNILFETLNFPYPIFTIHRDSKKPVVRRFSKRLNLCSEKTRATKNIIKNFGLAISAFIASDLVIPYLKSKCPEFFGHLQGFRQFVLEKKENLTNIINIRKMLHETIDDTEDEKKYRKLYRISAETFIKYFSVNWIYNSKVKYKESHVKYRGKLLRRIRNPKLFTYMA